MSSSPWVALVALSEPSAPEPDVVAARLADLFTDSAPLLHSGGLTFTRGGETANVTLVDQPIPWEKLEGPCATAWYWPDAEPAMRSHAAHLFITQIDEEGGPLDRASRLTQLVAAVAVASPAVGLVWGPSCQVHEPGAFTELATKMAPDDLPLHLWIDFRVAQRDDSGYRLFTTGMESLGCKEIEVAQFEGEPHALASHAYNIAHYILEKKPTIKDGEAIGLPDGAQATVSLEPSGIDARQEVMRLSFE